MFASRPSGAGVGSAAVNPVAATPQAPGHSSVLEADRAYGGLDLARAAVGELLSVGTFRPFAPSDPHAMDGITHENTRRHERVPAHPVRNKQHWDGKDTCYCQHHEILRTQS